MIDLHLLRVFVAVYKLKSFTKAAEELFLSQPTISEHIKTLESYLGCKLFDRIGKKVLPTEYASLLYERALEIIDMTDNIKNAIFSPNTLISGTLVIGASTIPSAYILPQIIAKLKKTHKNLCFKVVSMDSRSVIEKVANYEIVLGLSGTKSTDPNLEFIPFAKDEIVLITNQTLIKKPVVSLAELKTIPLILREEGSGTLAEVIKTLEKHGIMKKELNVVAEFGSNEAVKEAVVAGLGASFVSSLSISKEVSCKILNVVKVRNLKIHRNFYIVRHKKRTLLPLYEYLINLLKDNAAISSK